MRRKWYAGSPFDKDRIVPRAGAPEARQWQDFDAFQKNIWLWTETNRWIMEFADTFPPERFLTIHSERLFSGDNEALREIFAFVGTTSPKKRKVDHVLKQQLNAQHGGQFLDVDFWTDDMLNQLTIISGSLAKRLGYDFEGSRRNVA